ncbi:MAG: adenylate/guanylate cyclase domain-containing protein [Nitrospirota bacterium]|nr:adenylate/guanylate cyclase domain-containing protein [Nitrospirota bacterium]
MGKSLDRFLGSRLFPRVVGGVLLGAALALTLPDPAPRFMEALRLLSYDTLCRLYPGKPSGTPVMIVDIDLASLEQVGQWPWPRDITAALLSRIHSGGPKAVGFDIVFGEPDRTSPMNLLQGISSSVMPPNEVTRFLASLPDHDALLAESIGAGPTVLSYPFSFDEVDGELPPAPPPLARFVRAGGDPMPHIPYASFPDRNLPELEERASGIGFFNMVMFSDGIVRSAPSLIGCGEAIYPSLAMEMLRIGSGLDKGNPIVKTAEKGIEAVRVGDIIIPTDRHGNIWINFRGGAFTFPYVPAWKVLTGEVPESTFKGAYVLVGTSAAGLMDLRATPFDSVFPGVEVHAHLIDMALSGDFLRKPDWVQGVERVYLFLIGVVLIVYLPRIGSLKSGLLALSMMILVAVVGWSSFTNYRLIIDSVYPLLATFAIFSAMTFANYLREEREKGKLRGAFGQYLSPVIVQELAKHPEQLSLAGEEREMTILFSDIRGFTSFSEAMTPEALTRFLNEYMTPMTHHIMDCRGYVDKYIGDAIMAFWNAPLDDPAHAANACRSALLMQRTLVEMAPTWVEKGLPEVHIGIGINTGLTRVGNMGSDQRFNYTVIGDSVNLASRLEGLSKRYGAGIIVSEFTREHLKKTNLITRRLDRVRVKGKAEPVTIYELLEEADRITGEQVVEMELFDEALEYFYDRDFTTALARFSRLDKNAGGSLLCRMYAGRALAYQASPPPDDWDGVFTLTEK